MENIRSTKKIFNIFCILLICCIVFLIIRRAWCCDDAFITFRTLDNLVNGYHLTWNTYERVQAYTHPLWLLILAPFYAVTNEIYLTVISISVLLALSALIFLYCSTKEKRNLVVPLIVLMLSTAYIDFSTSGLENSLLNFLFAFFIFAYIKWRSQKYFHLIIYGISSLLLLTRLDTLLVILPILVFIIITDKQNFKKELTSLLIGFSPIILWELFSTFYYGFPFPNTFYAKLNAGIPVSEYLNRGLKYFIDTMTNDPFTFLAIIFGCVQVLVTDKRMKPFSLGIFLYILYVFYIGGDFMSGRMYVSIFFVSICITSQIKWRFPNRALIVMASFIFISVLFAECTPLHSYCSRHNDFAKSDIFDERQFYFGGTGLFRNGKFNTSIEMDGTVWDFNGYTWIAKVRANGEISTIPPMIKPSIGFLGYFGGPELKIIDSVGLSDPLIARLPAMDKKNWRIGHILRGVPDGYAQTLVNKEARIADPNINEYNTHLKIITQGDLFTKGRLLEIIRFNLGYYDYLLE